ACPHCPALRFPLSAMPRVELVRDGYQTAAGFTVKEVKDQQDPRSVVDRVEPDSAAARAGLQSGDRVTAVDGMENKIILDVSAPSSPNSLKRWGDEKQHARREVELISDEDGVVH